MPVVDNLLRVSKRPTRISSSVTGVGRRGSVAPRHRCSQRGLSDNPREAAVANALELSIPARARHPHFESDVRISGRLNHAGDPTEGRQLSERSGRARRRRERPGSDRLRRRYGRVCQFEIG